MTDSDAAFNPWLATATFPLGVMIGSSVPDRFGAGGQPTMMGPGAK